MFEFISERFASVFERFRKQQNLTADNIREGLKEVRRALLEADVAVEVVREFLQRVESKAIGQQLIAGVTPAQQIVQVVHDELIALMGEPDSELPWASAGPTVILLAGLQGSGKTTTAAKLAHLLQRQHQKRVLLVAADLQRPAAIEQLKTLGQQVGCPVFHREGLRPPELCAQAVAAARQGGQDVVILDTAGRLHVDEALMSEVAEVHARTQPHATLLVVDAMTGQDAVNSSKAFHQRLPLTGVIVTKLDGDARGGVIVSLRHVVGRPIKFVGVSEKLDGLQPFHPDRYARRILGMGDILTFVERAKQAVDDEQARRLEERIAKDKFDLSDFQEQLRAISRMGSLKDLLGLIPGLGAKFAQLPIDEKVFKRYSVIIDSMTKWERAHPELIDMSRRRRIAMGAGATTAEVQALLKHFEMMKKMMGKLGDVQELAKRLPPDGELTKERLANPQSFLPNPNRLLQKREDKEALRKYRAERKRKAKLRKQQRR
ncbi:MAG: signal recognition particle protein [Planctomycetota bacterium]|nr:signal recognition particle protein [Planctomycetota bacterium]MCX8040664.1 signal recognition particle protein [Planctomycetota bacterium]MDW8372807.1 signal recognition particle protein [Planctomycetota bacterium]